MIGPIYNYVRKANHRRSYHYRGYYEKLNVIDNTIFYESRDGKSVSDSPYAIFKYLVHHPEYKNFQHIWSVSNPRELDRVVAPYKGLNHVTFVKRHSKEYLKCLATSKYLINNSTFQSFFIPKDEQVYINTWHGTPLKRMGFDIPGNPAQSQNVVRNFISSDYLLSPNQHTTDIFLESYKLKGVYHGEIIQEGYPRIDSTYHTDADVFKSFLAGLALRFDPHKQTILYAPTWKGTSISKAKNDMEQIISDIAYLKKEVGEKYNIIIKVHPFLYNEARKCNEIKDVLIPDTVDTNELLSVVDILITDYSSIFFDYLVTNKPILFYIWDYETYKEERGIYLSDDELPGPTLFTIQEVSAAVRDITKISNDFTPVYQAAKNKFTSHDDGNVTARIVQYIFNNSKAPLNVIQPLETGKKKILIYPGGMWNNGITSSFINLTDNIDFNKYDVSVYMNTPTSNETLKNIEKVNKQARFLFRDDCAVNSLYEDYRDKFIHHSGAHTPFTKKLYPENAYKRESRRVFGRTKFDYAIDFSGYSLSWAKYILASNADKKLCFMHNDLLSDSERTINGRKPHRTNLRGLFSVYDRFDKLVSVSTGTMELNRSNLSEFAEEFKFDYAMNSINPKKILQLGSEDYTEHFKGNEKAGVQEPSPNNLNFVTMGRLSPEKGQDNLIKAFAQFHQGFANSKLYIIGEGPLRKHLEKVIADLLLQESVFLLGQLENPFPLMKKCDCFVLSSHYEGQPMVLLEAMTHGMKIIATDIVANRTVLENGRYGLLVENSIEGLKQGLNQLARNELNNKLDEFIPEEYNKKAMATFYNVLESEENFS